jgi:hypothetical protein
VEQLTELPSSIQVDNSWLVQGRVIPGSCSRFNVPELYLQLKYRDWPQEHYHTGQCRIPAELAVEIAMSVCIPHVPSLLAKSYDLGEHAQGISYTHMVKLQQPESCVGFITVNGLSVVVQIEGMENLFRSNSDCITCRAVATELVLALPPDAVLDRLMRIVGKEC